MKNWFCLLALALMPGAAMAQSAAAAPTAAASGYEAEAFSFQPPNPCRMPPEAPPRKLLDKKYDIQGLEELYTPNWLIFDIDGDGICDWVREGTDPTIYDQDPPLGENSIFLGTSTGWTYWRPADNDTSAGDIYNVIGVALYRHGDRRPILVYYQTLNSRDPFVSLFQLKIRRWTDKKRNLVVIDDEIASEVLSFVKRSICGNEVNFEGMIGNTERLAARGPGSLCGPRRN